MSRYATDEGWMDAWAEPPAEDDRSDRKFSRGAADLVVALSANGRTVRLFTADGDSPRNDRVVELEQSGDRSSGDPQA